MPETLLEVKNLKIYYSVKSKNSLFTKMSDVKAVDDISFEVKRGQTFGIVGESGCGKTTTGKALMRLVDPVGGEILLEGKNLTEYSRKDLAKRVQMIFQDPFSSLDPRMTVGKCIEEPLLVHNVTNAQQRKETAMQLLSDVGLGKEHYTKFPHEFSGGQRQRIGVARAIALHPDLVVCDEPVSALDVSIQAQILNLMQGLQKKYSLTYIFISHNLAVVKHLSDRIAVMYLGHIVELADKDSLFDNPVHPYTKALLSAIPDPDPDIPSMTGELTGDVPSPRNPPPGCCFHTRCPFAFELCSQKVPQLYEISPNHFSACFLHEKQPNQINMEVK